MKNEPAFPRSKTIIPGMKTIDDGANGITKREYFAAICPISYEDFMAIIKQMRIEFSTIGKALEQYANVRFMYADAMISESEKSDSDK